MKLSVELNSTALIATNPSAVAVAPALVSDTLYWQIVGFLLALNILVGLFATGSNIVTIIIYTKMGFADSTNISLTALAVSDLGSAVTAVVCTLGLCSPKIPNVWFTFEIFTIFASQPHLMFSRISALITTYISIERYLCVWLPLKIKRIITPKRTCVAMIIIFALPFALNLHLALSFPIGWKFYPERNRSLLGVLPIKYPFIEDLDNFRRLLFSVPLPLATAAIVFTCTILLGFALHKNKKWRDTNKHTSSNASSKKEDSSNAAAAVKSKEARAVERVIAITTVFIITSIPSCMHVFAVMTVPEFSVYGSYANLYLLLGVSYMVVDSINCSANVVIYYKMSTKFRYAMLSLFCGNSQ
ncbi:chemosensory receptor A [Elysia marginata]|uniref:Chemosensory receptor A n=1 Tax=Elysia marginata TaxID=1093978 RepID=A0AAV4EM15_9GAST|nr:chemosensory receptor A [Elysia marginata]